MNFPLSGAGRRPALWLALLAALAVPPVARAADRVNVLTYHNDNMRTGQNLLEKVLTPGSVNSRLFGKLVTLPVNGQIYAEPLYVSGLKVPGHGRRNVLFVATEHDSVYAFDADATSGQAPAPLWHVDFLDPAHGVTTVPAPDDVNSTDLVPEIGITGTPVIDPATHAIYLVAKTKEIVGGKPTYVQRLHALDLSTGAEKPGSPVVIEASFPGAGEDSDGKNVHFNPLREHQRAALLLDNGVVYIGWGSHSDTQPYHGWLIGYDAKSLRQVAVYNDSPNGGLDGIWQSGAGPACDSAGDIFCATGNGTGDIAHGCYSNAVLRLNASLALTDYFVPYNNDQLNDDDADLASGGVVLLPDSAGDPAHPHLLVVIGKAGWLYLIDRSHLGHQQKSSDDVVQSFSVSSAMFGDPAYFDGSLYVGTQYSALRQFRLVGGRVSETPASSSTMTLQNWGGTPAVSANGDADGIVWAIQQGDPGVLRAFDARDVSHELYDSDSQRDSLGGSVKFTVPTVANGRVYVGTQNAVVVYGLLKVYSSKPPSISDLSVTASKSSEVDLAWPTAAQGATGIEIERAAGDGSFDLLTTVAPDSLHYADSSVSPGDSYRYRLRAANTAGVSDPSNTVRAEIPAAARDPRLIAEWSFDTPSGSEVADSSGNGLGGRLAGEVNRIPGLVGAGALLFHAAGHAVSHVVVPDNPRLRFAASASFTIALWADPEVLEGKPETILEKSQGSPPWYAIGITQGGLWTAAGPNGELTGGPATTGWHHVTLVQDGAAKQRRLYIDGALVASGPAQPGDGPGELWIGQANPPSDAFAGAVDDVRIYNVALGADEIKSLSSMTSAP